MLPILFQAGPITIYSWGFFLALSYIAATFILWREGRRQGYNEEKLLDFSLVSLIAALIGGRTYFALLNWEFFAEDPVRALYFWEGGFAFHGSLLAVILAGIIFAKLLKWPFFQIADIGALSASAAIVIGKIGSFLAGLDFGRETFLPWAVTFPNVVGQRHPTQLYESVVYFIVLIFLYRLYFNNLSGKNMKSGKVFFSFLILSSLVSIILLPLRAQMDLLGPFSTTSLVSISVATISILALYYFQIRDFRADLRAFLGTFLVLNKRVLRKLKF